jgi:1-acyl-sn-glycerol-3-phosphate acyltransferase
MAQTLRRTVRNSRTAIPRLRRLGQLFFRVVLQSVVHVQATGLERIPKAGPFIIVINHVNFLDGALTYLFAPCHLVGFGKVEVFESPLLGPLMRFGGVIPVRRRTPDVGAVRHALAELAAGEILMMAPEGTRSRHGRLQQGRPGVVLLAVRTGAPILPVAVWGHERFWHNLARLLRTRVWIHVGYPFYLRAGEGRLCREKRDRMLRTVMCQLAGLLPSSYRGIYADLDGAVEQYLYFPSGSESNLATEVG